MKMIIRAMMVPLVLCAAPVRGADDASKDKATVARKSGSTPPGINYNSSKSNSGNVADQKATNNSSKSTSRDARKKLPGRMKSGQ